MPFGPLLYPVVGALAVGAGLTIPSVTSLISRRSPDSGQGRLMGGIQSILSLTLILGPIMSGLAFDHLGVPAPYWIGGLLAALALGWPRDPYYRPASLSNTQHRTSHENREFESMTSPRATSEPTLRIGIIILTLGTAFIHLTLAFPDAVFILNGLGYLTLLVALYLPIPQLTQYRHLVRWTLVGYTALTIFLWVLFGARTPIGYIDKLIEAVLIALLIVEARCTR